MPGRAGGLRRLPGRQDGCPDPDNDDDGILDKDDRCPNEPEDRDGDQDDDGCPEGADGDRDGDGIPDTHDKCPDDPEDKDGFEDEDGCPDPDNDKDGIPDKDDQCPNEPEDKDGFEDEDGCPDPDNDKDGILDVDDKCPNEPETFNGFEDEDGCPDKGKVIIEENNIVILEEDQLQDGVSAEILPESNAILDAVATTLIHHPEFTLIEIAGHADERATDELQPAPHAGPRQLRHRGARAARGRPTEHSARKGYGEYCPIDPGPQRGGLGEEPPRRVQDRATTRRPHRRRARLRQPPAKGVGGRLPEAQRRGVISIAPCAPPACPSSSPSRSSSPPASTPTPPSSSSPRSRTPRRPSAAARSA